MPGVGDLSQCHLFITTHVPDAFFSPVASGWLCAWGSSGAQNCQFARGDIFMLMLSTRAGRPKKPERNIPGRYLFLSRYEYTDGFDAGGQ